MVYTLKIMQTDGTNTLSLIVGPVQSNSKETSSDRRYSAAARWRACLLSITCYYVTWASCKCSIFGAIKARIGGATYITSRIIAEIICT